ncbi:MAG: transcriptional repressor [Chromatiales bacterium]|nr:transcriptional repressor [Chromatiales bacterium]
MARLNIPSPFPQPDHDHSRCVHRAIDAAERACARRGSRLTSLRRRVLELVWDRHEPVKAYELMDELRDEREGVAPPTVYRSLEFLLDQGLIHRIESMNAYVGCANPDAPHVGQFLICEVCGGVAEMSDPSVSASIHGAAERLGFRVTVPVIEIRGLCPACDGAG